MNKELREKIIAYNKKRRIEKEAYDDLLRIVKPLFLFEKTFPREVREILEKYREVTK